MNMHTVDWIKSHFVYPDAWKIKGSQKVSHREAVSLQADEFLISCVAAGDSVLAR